MTGDREHLSLWGCWGVFSVLETQNACKVSTPVGAIESSPLAVGALRLDRRKTGLSPKENALASRATTRTDVTQQARAAKTADHERRTPPTTTKTHRHTYTPPKHNRPPKPTTTTTKSTNIHSITRHRTNTTTTTRTRRKGNTTHDDK